MSRALSTLAAILLPLSSLPAQQSAATPFRDGQWAAQFGWTGGLTNLGVLAFTGPTGAWLLDVQFAWVNSKAEISGAFASDTGDDDFLGMGVRVGRRLYQARGAKVVTYQSLGVLGNIFEETRLVGPGTTFSERGNSFGAFGEIGAAYTITQNLSIGFTGTVRAERVTVKREFPPGTSTKTSGFAVSAPTLLFVSTIYF